MPWINIITKLFTVDRVLVMACGVILKAFQHKHKHKQKARTLNKLLRI